MEKELLEDFPYMYVIEFEEDILYLIDAIKSIHPYTEDGKIVKRELLNKLYNEL